MEKLNRFPQEAEVFTPLIGKGQFASVYAITDNHVAKVYNWPYLGDNLRDMQEEYENTREAWRAGISVPKPEGVFEVDIRWWKTAFGLFFPKRKAFVMEWIHGVRADDKGLDKGHGKRARELFHKEVEKCESLGFFSGDFRLNNAIYVPYEKKIYLIDLADCARVSPAEKKSLLGNL